MSALLLRALACVCMLLDHIGFCTGSDVLRCIGRLAFPLFVFLLVNGFRKTSSRPRYALRLAVFALLSQIPFSLLIKQTTLSSQGNVFFTLLAALLCLWAADALRRRKQTAWLCLVPSLAVFALYYFGYLSSDYGAKGLLLALVFYFCNPKTLLGKLAMLLGVLAVTYHAYLISLALWCLRRLQGVPFSLPALRRWDLQQAFGLLALPPIWLYRGRLGWRPQRRAAARAMQLGFYLFYPAHMLVLWLIYFA